MHTFKRQPLLLRRAKGSYVWDNHGKKYLDFFSGLAVCGIGHNNQRVVKAVHDQSLRLMHVSNYFYTDPQFELAKSLTSKWSGSRVFFSNSGGEANEFAIKLARLWATKNHKKGREIIGFENSFHGRTLATLAASNGKTKSNENFQPLPAGFRTVPYNDLEKTARAISSQTIGIILEPIQGEGGINVASQSFLKGVQNLCRKHNLILIVDEVQSGMGRTGTFFAFEAYDIKPDIVTLAKGLAGGLPLGATLAAPHIWKYVVPGLHGSTFGGNPVACADSLEVLKLLTPKALRTIKTSGEFIFKQLSTFSQFPQVKTIRGRGLMIGIELNCPGDAYVGLARKMGLLINCTQGNVLRFLPPYFISKKEIDLGLRILRKVFEIIRHSRESGDPGLNPFLKKG